jgi:hypothetical protein
LKINLRIQFLSGDTTEVTAVAADLVAFEDKFNLSVTKLDEQLKFTHLLFLAWHSLKRIKKTDLDFSDWVNLVESAGASEADPK